MAKVEKAVIISLLIILFIVRLYHIDAAPLEIEESWRQADTESIAKNFVKYDFNILHPNFNYDGPLPNIPALEIQATTFLIAILYKLLGFNYIFARLVPIVFFLASAFYLYLLSRKYMDILGASACIGFYGLLPINIYYSRAIMPESAALFFFIAGFYYFDRWFEGKHNEYLIFSCLLISLSIMTKPPTLFIGIPMLYLCIKNMGPKFLKSYRLWLFVIFLIGIPTVYYYYSISIAEFKFSMGLTQNLLLKQLHSSLINYDSKTFFLKNLPRAFTLHSFYLIPIGILCTTKKQRVILVFFIAMVLECIIIVGVIRAFYYLIFLTVPCSMLLGNGVSRLFKYPIVRIFVLIWLYFMLQSSIDIVKPMYRINEVMQTQVYVLNQTTNHQDLIVVGSIDPCLLSLSDRRGWRYLPEKGLDYYIKAGAKYFAPIRGKINGDRDDKLFKFINSKYEKIEIIKGYPIYKLQ